MVRGEGVCSLGSTAPRPSDIILNMSKKLVAILIIAVAVIGGTILYLRKQLPGVGPTPVSGPTPISEPEPVTDDKGVTPAGINAVVNASNQFALDAYSELRKEDGNIFFSPYSISTALAMVYEGARGKTAEEIQRVFHFPTDNDARRAAFAAIHNQLNEANSKYKLSVANALWAQNDYKFLDEYITILQQYFAAKATNVDFAKATEEARKTINTWVEKKTNSKIEDLFPKGSLNDATRLVLTNAIYFKGQWVKQFDKKQTIDEDFRISSANTVRVPMMRQTGESAKFKYTETKDAQVLEMPYEGEKLSMLILLPKNDNLVSLENSLSPEELSGWESELKERRVDVFIPKFTFDTKYTLNETLQKMGMPTAFLEGIADFSGMDGTRGLFIQTVIHQAFVDVNEEGTEAAAATGVGIGATAVELAAPVFRADHPFIFIIQDSENGNILFFGRVENPKT